MTGEAPFTVRTDVHALHVGGASQKQLERAALDIKSVLVSMRDDDGVPVLPLGDHPHELSGENAGCTWRLEVSLGRALTEGEQQALSRAVEQVLWPPLPAVRKVHHLSCATMCPVVGSLWNEHKKLVCHCLLIETEQGLVLVDTGLGTHVCKEPKRFVPAAMRFSFGPTFQAQDSAAAQIEKLGHKLDDVRHIVLTHMDIDHAGGLMDFPQATVHAMTLEKAASQSPKRWFDKQRYAPALWAHDVKWQLHDVKGERWYGFNCVRDLPGLPPEILMVPLPGHTEGHCGVAVDVGGRWLLHCGDAYFHRDELHPTDPWCSPALRLHQRIAATDDALRKKNQVRLRELARGAGDGISVFCAHDPDDLARLRAG